MDKGNSPINVSDHVESWLENQETDSSAVLSYIKQMLMEEDTEEKYSMFQDSSTLQDTERSFYELITPPPPPPPAPPSPPSSYASSSTQHVDNYPNVGCPDQSLSISSTDYSTSSGGSSCGSSSSINNSADDYNPPMLPNTFPIPIPDNFVLNSYSTSNIQSSINTGFGFFENNSMPGFLDSTLLSNTEYPHQFDRGLEQGTQFLPQHTTPFIIDLENATFIPSSSKDPQVVTKTELESVEGEQHFVTVSKGRKNREREEYEAEGRSRKQSAVYMDDNELSELFDKVLLGTGLGKGVPPNTTLYQNDEPIFPNKIGGDFRKSNEEEVVDLRTMLMLCAEAIASDSPSFAKQLVKQIKQHSSPIGDETQRLAHYFGDALEARLDGTGYQVYKAQSSKRTSAKEMVKAYYFYVSICPFEKLAIIYANNSIWNNQKNAETIHIIDFGIRYGFKWPKLISRLSTRPGGPPKIRITGIDMPQPGFRPDERVLETGRRLESYCKRFNVPFEFNAIAQRWDTIKLEDLKIENSEFVAVNCMFQFEHLLDETVVLNNPRDAVLRLIKKANPGLFVHSIVNGSYDVPFFVSRFREALFQYSALFDMLDTNAAREDPMRLMFEKDLFGREIMNIIGSEGSERIERPQTYKQWQLRNMRAGLKPLPLDHQLTHKLNHFLRNDAYNKNFMVEEQGNWTLQGWKGRILHASSCWVPA